MGKAYFFFYDLGANGRQSLEPVLEVGVFEHNTANTPNTPTQHTQCKHTRLVLLFKAGSTTGLITALTDNIL